MGWIGIITAILSVLGPIIAEWLKKWLESRLQEVTARMPPAENYPSEADARDAVLDEVIRTLPRFAFARRAMLRRLKALNTEDGFAVEGEDLEELADLARAAENE